jgi:hypothetical protein
MERSPEDKNKIKLSRLQKTLAGLALGSGILNGLMAAEHIGDLHTAQEDMRTYSAEGDYQQADQSFQRADAEKRDVAIHLGLASTGLGGAITFGSLSQASKPSRRKQGSEAPPS